MKELELIKETVCKHLNISEEQLNLKTRKSEVVKCRQICHYLVKNIYGNKFPLRVIGEEIGGKNHVTVLYGEKVCKDIMSYDKNFISLIDELKEKIIVKLEKLDNNIAYKETLILLRIKARRLINKSKTDNISIVFNHQNYTKTNHLTSKPIRL